MASIKFTIKKKANAEGLHPIIIQIIKDRKNTTLSLKKFIKFEDWSFETQRVKSQNKKHKSLNAFISKYQELAEKHIEELQLKGVEYSIADIIKAIKTGFSTNQNIPSFSEYITILIANNKNTKHNSTNVFYRDTLNSMKKCIGKETIFFYEITSEFLFRYESNMRSRSLSNATIGMRMRTLRSIINKAIKSEIIPESYYPFKKYTIKTSRNEDSKEILTIEELDKLKHYEPLTNEMTLAKDLFLFSYYSRGINFVDLMQLKSNNISNKTITYARSKTGVIVSFKLNERSEQILNTYITPNTPYLFPFLKISNPAQSTIENLKKKKLKEININLKRIMKVLGIQKNITYYCARHTFATHLKFNNISIEIIREALGQKDINSTISYLKTLPSNQLDKIIEDIIK